MKDLTKSEISQIRKITAFLRREGIQKIKIDENALEIELAPQKPVSKYIQKKLSADNGVEDGEVQLQPYSEEDREKERKRERERERKKERERRKRDHFLGSSLCKQWE